MRLRSHFAASLLAFFAVPAALQGCGSGVPQAPAAVASAPSFVPLAALSPLRAAAVSVASYNVENLWDDDDTNTSHPYDDYARGSSNWTRDDMVSIKVQHVAEALALAGSPDIVGIQEVEWAAGHSRALDLLASAIRPQGYRYFVMGQQAPDTAVTTAVLSKYPIVSNETLSFGGDSSARSPQVVTININGSFLRLYNSHWKSKRGGDAQATEPQRMRAALLIRADMDRVRQRDPSADMILVGDLNSRYNESQIEQRGPTGIVEGLRATGDERMMVTASGTQRLYKIWFELPPEQRGSSVFRGEKNAIDHIILSDALFDNSGLQYIQKSFEVIGAQGLAAQKLLDSDGSPSHWKVFTQRGRNGGFHEHQGAGYSDHLPVVAHFRVLGPTGDLQKMPLTDPSTTEFGPASRVYVRPHARAW